jgi:hypothetical protein
MDRTPLIYSDSILSVWIEEYKALNSDIQNRVSLQHSLMNFHILILVGVLGLLVNYPNRINENIFLFIILILPFISFFFVWRHLNHDINIIDKAIYIYSIIRPNIIKITCGYSSSDLNNIATELKLLNFEHFLEQRRKCRISQFGTLVFMSGEHFFHFIVSIILMIIQYVGFFFPITEIRLASNFEELLIFSIEDLCIILSALALYGTISVRVKVARGYGSIINQCH